ncbi:MAG: fatty acid desaturase [Pseudomonadota bacterium]
MKQQHHIAHKPFEWRGVLIAFLIISLWTGHLFYALKFSSPSHPFAIPHVLIQAFLNVGLFITAHDAIHGSLAPGRRRLNDSIGAIALFLYGGFFWKKMRDNHHAHHAAPVTEDDPDYAINGDERPGRWLYSFLVRYYSWRNLIAMFLHVGVTWSISGSYFSMLLFFAVPAWISAIQLFVFGVYLPHKTPPEGHTHPHKTKTIDHPVWLSMLTCYHFGYHEEHHDYPGAPWWRLPAVRRIRLLNEAQTTGGSFTKGVA